MKKKYKLLITLIVVLIIITAILYVFYTYKKLLNDKFSIRNGEENLVDIKEIPFNYSLIDAFKDGYVIVVPNGSITNESYLTNFYKDYLDGKNCAIRVAIEEKDSHIEFVDLKLEDGKLTVTLDDTRDKDTVFQHSITTTDYKTEDYYINYNIVYNKVIYSLQRRDRLNNKQQILFSYTYNGDPNTDFTFEFEPDDAIDKELISENNSPYNFNLYSYKGHAYININDEKILLKDAIANNKITVDDVLLKLYEDSLGDMPNFIKYKENGTYLYKYENFWILKGNTDDGFQDLYMGPVNMYYSNNDVTIVNN